LIFEVNGTMGLLYGLSREDRGFEHLFVVLMLFLCILPSIFFDLLISIGLHTSKIKNRNKKYRNKKYTNKKYRNKKNYSQ
jgi:hypothetical protein